MKLGVILFFILTLALSAFAQSGRNKPAETPSPTPVPIKRPTVIYVPTQAPSRDRTVPTATPRPTPTPDDDVLTVESTLVPIPVSVLDAGGRPVTTLKLSDFELTIDGKPAEISEISRSETPIRLAMLFDNSSSVTLAREFEKEAAIRFFNRVVRPEKDMAALFSVADYTRLEQPFTRNVSQLVQAIRMFPEPRGATALLDGIIEVAEYLASADGRRVVVIVSDGEDTYSDLSTTLEKVLRWLQVANCQVYVVKTKDFENFKRTGVRGGNANIRVLDAERRMLELAKQTGGAVYSPIDEREMDAAFRQISAELSQQYILSYYPDEAGRAGDFRSIALNVKSRPDMDVRTRKGYYVPKR